MLTIRGRLITPFVLGSMSVGLNILIRHSFMDLWFWITALVPWPQLLVKVYKWVLLQLAVDPVTPVYQIVSSLGHVAISYFFFCDFYGWKEVSKWERLNVYTARHHTTPWMIELHNANVTDRFVAIPYAMVRYQKSVSQRFVTVFRADLHKVLSETDLCISARRNRMALSVSVLRH